MEAQSAPRHKNALLVAVVVLLLWTALGILDVRNTTYSGYLTDGNNTVTQVTEGSPADNAGLQTGDHIRSIGGISVEDTRALTQQQRPTVGETRAMEVERDGQMANVDLEFAALPTNQALVSYFAILIGVCFLLFGLWAYLAAPGGATQLLAVLGVFFAPAFVAGPYFSSAAVRTAVGSVVTLLVVLGFAVLMHFLLVFPRPKQIVSRPNAKWVIYGPAAIVALFLLWFGIFQPDATSTVNVFFRLLIGLFIAGYFGVALIAMIHSYIKASAHERAANGLTILLLGTVLGLGPIILNSVVGLFAPRVVLPGAQYYFLTLVLIPVTFALAAVRAGRPGPQAAV